MATSLHDDDSPAPSLNDTAHMLLVGGRSTDWTSLRKALDALEGVACLPEECTGVEQCLDFILQTDLAISMIFLDLTLFDTDYPKERFLLMRKLIPGIPIVVLTDRTDYDLIHFVMTAGAAETFSLWQLSVDEDRLKNIVQSCQARAHIAARQHALLIGAIEAAKTRNAAAQEEAASDDADESASAQKIQREERRALKKENTLLRNELDVAWSNQRRHKHARMPVITGPDSQDFLDAIVENDKLRAELQAASKLLTETIRKSDAVLKYAQEKGAIDLKKIHEQNRALIRYNNFAREWLSGSGLSYGLDDELQEPDKD